MARRPRPTPDAQLELGFQTASREVERVFLGWDRPLLPLVVDHLLAHAKGAPIDLRHLLIVTPVARAGSRLLESLVLRAEESGRTILPPRVVTTGALLDLLAPPSLPSPHRLVRALLWGEALRAAPAAVRDAVVPSPPSADDWPGWIRLGRLLDGLDAELAAGLLTFDDVVERARDLESFRGAARWRALARVRALLEESFDRLGLDDAPTRRRDAIATRALRLPAPACQLALLGCAELNGQVRSAVDLLRGQATAWVHAPVAKADRFDRFGAILPSSWQDGPLGDVAVSVVDGPSEQAACVAGALSELAAECTLQDVVIGVPDADVIPVLRETLDQLGVPTRNAAGIPMHRSGLLRLLRAVGEYLESRSFRAIAALARHPDVVRRVETPDERVDWRTLLDQYQQDRVPHVLGERFLGQAGTAESLALRLEALESTLGDLRGPPRPMPRWAEPIVAVIVAYYGQRPLNPEDWDDRVVITVAAAVRDALRAIAELPEDVVGFVPAATALRIVVDTLEQETVPEPPEKEAVELLGWLELSQDDASAVVLTGFNDGFVPGSVNEDPFLPDTLRRHLGLADNRLRFARDAFYLSTLVASRRYVKLLAGRRTRASDPLAPSRLWLCGESRTVAERVLSFYEGAEGEVPLVRGTVRAGQGGACLCVPRPRPLDRPIDRLTVTAFHDYLACPYRFYLKHVLKLRPLGDGATELTASSFGNLAHVVLADFGRGPLSSSRDAAQIRAFLGQSLDEHVQASFGCHAAPAVYLQVEQLRARLGAFAVWQARWAAGGKRILHTELGYEDGQVSMDVDGIPFGLLGRIDRIDEDEATGVLYVFDYKVSGETRSPKDHLSKGEWKNLQLPLYRRLVTNLAGNGKVELGYITLPDADEVTASLAGWTEEELQSADEVAAMVIRSVRGEVFWPPSSRLRYDDFGSICQETRLGGPVLEEARP
jgi:ATP-dependent helicase/nuclease subunit B